MWILPTNEAVCLPLQAVQSVYLCKLSVSFHKLSKLTPLAVCLTLQTQQSVSFCRHPDSVSLYILSSLFPFFCKLRSQSPFANSAVCLPLQTQKPVPLCKLRSQSPFANLAVCLPLQTQKSVSLCKQCFPL